MLDSLESFASFRNRSEYEMEIDKPDCEVSDVHDRKEKDDVEQRIQAKHKLL